MPSARRVIAYLLGWAELGWDISRVVHQLPGTAPTERRVDEIFLEINV